MKKNKPYDNGVRVAKILEVVNEGGNGRYITVTYEFKSKKQADQVVEQFLLEDTKTDFCLDLE